MTYMIVLLFVSLLAFGLPRQSINYPDHDWSWLLVRNIFYKARMHSRFLSSFGFVALLGFSLLPALKDPELKAVPFQPYFMLYGEVYADEIDVCGDDGETMQVY